MTNRDRELLRTFWNGGRYYFYVLGGGLLLGALLPHLGYATPLVLLAGAVAFEVFFHALTRPVEEASDE